ncbi:MAG: glutathione S-transferase N-terminal domain-containing protein [Proteobacteria bacterium]|nr:glutathione S-transferase N-terminal domain-containing protein [Pseudomonadota bacterium]
MALVLYELGGRDGARYSLFSWRTRLALAHKGLAAELKPVRVSDKAAIAFSGQAKVPILVDGDTVVCDSWKIAEHLEDRHGGPSLFGGAVGRGLARVVNAWVDRQIVPAAALVVAPDVIDIVDDQDAAHIRSVMEKGLGRSFETMRAERTERLTALRRLLDPARATLRAQPFLSGDAPAYGDYILFSVFQWARIAGTVALLDEADQPMTAWHGRVLDLYDGLAVRAPARAAAA